MRTKIFTLLEVVIAMGVLAVAMTGLLQLMIQSQERMAKGYVKWRETHLLMQAAEYYLLQSGEDPGGLPVDFFPYDDYQVHVSYRDAEGLPEDFNNLVDQLPLRTCVIELERMRDRKVVDTLLVDRISYESTIQGE